MVMILAYDGDYDECGNIDDDNIDNETDDDFYVNDYNNNITE